MSAVVATSRAKGLASNELEAPKRSRRLARAALIYTVLLGILTAIRVSRPEVFIYHAVEAGVAVMLGGFAVGIALLGAFTRAARLRIDEEGVRWGYDHIGFQMRRPRLAVARLYEDAVALCPKRGTPWYLSSRDWQPWERMGRSLRVAGIPVEEHPRRAPLRARLQAYGVVLDLLLILAFLLATTAFVFV
jgi:hypothetical protein